MSDWKHKLLGVIDKFETFYDERKFELKKRLGLGELMIQPYLGHGTTEKLYLKGRVLRDKHITDALEDDTIWTNLLNMYKRYQSAEIPGALVRARVGDVVAEVTTNDEGYFYFELTPTVWPEATESWYEIALELVDYPGKEANDAEPQTVTATGKVIVPPVNASFGVISDIDDTVLQTNVLDLLAMARNTFLMNSRTRLPFEGVAAFYQALRRGGDGGINPIYYLSSSAWNLYDMLHDFFVIRNIPLGPFFLVDMGIDKDKFIVPTHHEHKVRMAQTLLDTHPDLPFILIGDSGQKDPEIYMEVVEKNPGRVLAVYIRDVRAQEREAEFQGYAERAKAVGTELLAVADTVAAAVHASTHGWIKPDALPTISEDTAEDKQAPTPLEEALRPTPEPEPPRTSQQVDNEQPEPKVEKMREQQQVVQSEGKQLSPEPDAETPES
jgi:phosphatidate phosphatase APP1